MENEQSGWSEAKEQIGKMLRWTEQPRNAEDQSEFLGAIVEGTYVSKKTDIGQNASNIYEIKTRDGQLYSMWGSALLDGKFAMIPVGSEVNIQFLGITQPKTANGRPFNNFKIMHRAAGFEEAVPSTPVATTPIHNPAPQVAPAPVAQIGTLAAPVSAVPIPAVSVEEAAAKVNEALGAPAVNPATAPVGETVPVETAPNGEQVAVKIPF